MKKRMIALSGIAIATLLTFNACDSTSRYDDEAGSGIENSKPEANQPSTGVVTDNPEPFVPITTPNTGNIPDTNQTDANDTVQIKTINGTYSVKFTPEFDSMTAGQTQNIHYEISNFFTKKPADNSVVNYLKFEIDDKYAEFFDPQGRHGDTIEFKNGAESTGDIAIKSSSLSGQVRMNFNAVIDNTDINLTKSFPITIEKNKSSSMAIVPYETVYDGKGLFIQKYVIHVVDSYGNKAKDGTNIQTGVINNPKLYSRAYNGGKGYVNGVYNGNLDSQTLPRTLDGKVSKMDFGAVNTDTFINDKNETITYYTYAQTVDYHLKDDKATLNKSNGTFTLDASTSDKINSTISNLDTLIVLANKKEHKPYNLGGWDIEKVLGDSQLKVYDLDKADDVSGVSYVIGDEYRYDECSRTIMNAAASSFEVTKIEDGVAYAELRYTPAMVGKNIFIYANSKLDDNRIGISRKVLLTGTGLEEVSFSCKNESKTSFTECSESFLMIQNDSGKIAREVYVAQPVVDGTSVGAHATITRTGCNGMATIRVYNVPPEKAASFKFGGKILSNELIINQK
jgi:hypothetical protein